MPQIKTQRENNGAAMHWLDTLDDELLEYVSD